MLFEQLQCVAIDIINDWVQRYQCIKAKYRYWGNVGQKIYLNKGRTLPKAKYMHTAQDDMVKSRAIIHMYNYVFNKIVYTPMGGDVLSKVSI
jgi:hypothetical protein